MDPRFLAALASLGLLTPAQEPPWPREKHPALEPYQDAGPRRSPRNPAEIDYLYGPRPAVGRNKRRKIPARRP